MKKFAFFFIFLNLFRAVYLPALTVEITGPLYYRNAWFTCNGLSTNCWCNGSPQTHHLTVPDLESNRRYAVTLTASPDGNELVLCGSSHPLDGLRVNIIGNSGCHSVYINDVRTNAYLFPDTETFASMVFDLRSDAGEIEFNPPEPINSTDGEKQVLLSVSGVSWSNNVVWSIVSGDTLGCTITNVSRLIVPVKAREGQLMIRASNNVPAGCFIEKALEIKGCGNSCPTCTSTPGGVSCALGCVDAKFSLGQLLDGSDAGFASIFEELPSNALYTPSTLKYNYARSGVAVKRNGLTLQQVSAPNVFLDVVTHATNSYSLRFYNPTNIGFSTGTSTYVVTGSPFSTVTITNVGFSTNWMRILKYDAQTNLMTTWDYKYVTNGWTLSVGGQRQTRTTNWVGSLKVVTRQIDDGVNSAVYLKTETFTNASYGERMIQSVVGSGASAKTNSFSFTSTGLLEQAIREDGSWEYYFYDAYDRPTNVLSGFGNQSVTTTPSSCRSTEYAYSASVVSGSGDTLQRNTNAPRRVIEKILNTEVKRRYYVYLPGEMREYIALVPGAAWSTNSTDFLVTTNVYFTSGIVTHLNDLKGVMRPDGTGEAYQYFETPTNATQIILSGHLTGGGTNVDDGTRTVVQRDEKGRILTNSVYDIFSGVLIQREINKYDYLSRLTNTVFLDGTTNQSWFQDCCLTESSRGRDGSTTTNIHDVLGRLITRTENGITISNLYDPAGNLLAVTRIGTDGSMMAQGENSYDLGGNLIISSNALGHPTTFSNYFDGSGYLVKRTTYPNQTTRIERFNKDGTPESVTGTSVHGVRYEYGVETDGSINALYTKEIKLYANGSDSGEWKKTYSDMADRVYKTTTSAPSGTPTATSTFNALGQMTRQSDADGISTLFKYNAKGEAEYTAIAMGGNTEISWSSDRITRTLTQYIPETNTRRAQTYVWIEGGDVSNLVSTVETAVSGLTNWSTLWVSGNPITSSNRVVYTGDYVITTNWGPDGTYTVSTNQFGKTLSNTRYAVGGAILAQQIFSYDSHGRQILATDIRGSFVTNTFDALDRVTTARVQAGALSQSTTTYYDSMGRVERTILPDNGAITNRYHPTGEQSEVFGERQYPVGYGYDYAGRLTSMTNWTSYPSTGARVTTWSYDVQGLLSGKSYAGTDSLFYTHTLGGRMKTSTSGRAIVATYGTNAAGEIITTSFSDGTPGITNTFDRRGRLSSVFHGAITTTRTYNDAGALLTETYSGGLLNGLGITNTYDSLMRLFSTEAMGSTNIYGYDAGGRIQHVTNGTMSVDYGYLTNSSLIENVVFKQSGTNRMTTIKGYDLFNRLTNITSITNAATLVSYSYQYNDANQRTSITMEDNSYWTNQYDRLGQVIASQKHWSDGTFVAGQQFTNQYDDIGNRVNSGQGGNASGGALRTANYTVNDRNQYEQRTVPAAVDVMGSATNSATVTVNKASTYRKGDYFWKEYSVINSIQPAYVSLTNLAVLSNGTNSETFSTNVVHAFVSKTPEKFTYDGDGNLTSDGRWTNRWDAWNRLTGITSRNNAPAGSECKQDYVYDFMGRRIAQVVYTNISGAYTAIETNKFIYDGWNLVAVLDATNRVLRTFCWGLDLSGNHQGAGGVGGLLAVREYDGSIATNFCYAYDGNGNVVRLVHIDDSAVSAEYEYGPFGEPTKMIGRLAKTNPIRFSTRYVDDQTDMIYFGFRYCNPSTGRWLSKDSIQEAGGVNLYGFCGNDSLGKIDILGQDFIAVGSVGIATLNLKKLGISHMSMLFYKESPAKSPFGLKFTKSSTPSSASLPFKSIELGKIDYRFGHKAPNDISMPNIGVVMPFGGASWIYDDVSYIAKNLATPERMVVVYTDRCDENKKSAEEKWKEIEIASDSYQYAEGIIDNVRSYMVLRRWPKSHYQANGNNSNTFVRTIVKQVLGEDADMVGDFWHSHPGNDLAQDVNDPGYTPHLRGPNE